MSQLISIDILLYKWLFIFYNTYRMKEFDFNSVAIFTQFENAIFEVLYIKYTYIRKYKKQNAFFGSTGNLFRRISCTAFFYSFKKSDSANFYTKYDVI